VLSTLEPIYGILCAVCMSKWLQGESVPSEIAWPTATVVLMSLMLKMLCFTKIYFPFKMQKAAVKVTPENPASLRKVSFRGVELNGKR
jgi:hypothetical protein